MDDKNDNITLGFLLRFLSVLLSGCHVAELVEGEIMMLRKGLKMTRYK